jgi:tetratricopeptide (TPR) repeat protein
MRVVFIKWFLILVFFALFATTAIAQSPTPEATPSLAPTATPIPEASGPIRVGPFALSDLVGFATLVGIIIVGLLSGYAAYVLRPMQRREVQLLERQVECVEREKEALANVLREEKTLLEMQLREAKEKANIPHDVTLPPQPVPLDPKDREVLQQLLTRLERIEGVSIATGAEMPRPDPWKYLSEGNLHFNLRQYEKAVQTYNKALDLKPDLLEALVHRGYAYDQLGQHERAIQDYHRAFELKSDDPTPRYYIACSYSLMNKPDEALKWLREAIDLDQKCRDEAKTDPDFDNIRDDPRFKELIGE